MICRFILIGKLYNYVEFVNIRRLSSVGRATVL